MGLPLLFAALIAASPAADQEVRIVYTGGSGGVGSVKYSFEVLRELDRAGIQIVAVQSFHGAMARGPWTLWADDRRVASVVGALRQGSPGCGPPLPSPALISAQDALIVEADTDAGWLSRLGNPPQALVTRRCEAGGVALTLIGPVEEPLPDWSLEGWEFRRALHASLALTPGAAPVSVDIIGQPLQELARNTAAIETLLAEHPGSLYVDAGDLLDGASSVRDGALSLHRPTDLAVIGRLRPAALVPGNNELLAGAHAFVDETRDSGASWVATNLRAEDPLLPLPRAIVRTVQTEGGPVRLAFLGVLDPSLNTYIPALAAEGVTIIDPVDALNAEVRRLADREDPPDAVLVLGTVSDALRARIRREVRGVDVLIGDPSLATLRVIDDTTTLRALPDGAKGAAVTLPMDGIATLDLIFSDGVLRELRVQPRLVRAEAPADPDVLARVTRVRAEVYPGLDRPLLDAPDPAATLSPEAWSALVCEAVRRRTEADTVLLRALPPPPRQPGPLSEMMVIDQLALLDVLEVHYVSGLRMPDLLDKAYSVAPVTCGAKPGELYPRARGRLLETGRTYRVVTTDRTRAGSLLDGILSSVESLRPLDQPTREPLLAEDGAPLTLRMATLDSLRTLRDARGGTAGLTDWLVEEAPAELPPLWLLRLRALSLSASRFRGVNDDAFAEIPETLVTAPDSALVDGSLDLALEHGSARTEWDLRLRADYGLIGYGGADPEESSDDLIFSSSLALPRLTWPDDGPLRLMPYGELRQDSELSPTEGNPRQADLSLLVGLSAVRTATLRGLHLGALANEDLSDPGPPELGLRADLQTLHLVGDAMKIQTSSELQLYGGGPAAEASDPGLLAEAELKLAFPLAWWLELCPTASGLLVRGRVPETEHLGLSWTLGLSLQAASVFEL